MKHSPLLTGAALAFAVALAGCGVKQNTKAAEAEIDRFHQRWNADEFKVIYNEAHKNLRNSRSADEIVAMLQRGKQNYGAFKSSTRRSWGFNSDNGVTNITLKYDSTYDRGPAVEAFIYRMSGDAAQLLSYEIMSPETAKKLEEAEKAEREAKRKADAEKRKAERDARKSPKRP
jgi:hypothetical protein